MAISPDGRTVFVTGTTGTEGINQDWATIAYQAATGARLWTARYDGPGKSGYDAASLVATSRDGKTVFVDRIQPRPQQAPRRGLHHDRLPGRHRRPAVDRPVCRRGPRPIVAMAVRPGGGTVIVTGTNGNDYATVAYRASTGARLWARHHGGPTGFRLYGGATALAFSPDGRTVFVTGDSHNPGTPDSGITYATIAYHVADGTQRWAVTDNPLASSGGAAAVAVSPDGRTVLVTGKATVAYRAATGAQQWASPSLGGGYASALAVSPDGRKVFVTGPAFEPGSGTNIRAFTAVAFGSATGARLSGQPLPRPPQPWRYWPPGGRQPNEHRVYVAGETAWFIPHSQANRYTIIAYRA